MPRLSVILSSFNRPAGLRRAALSVLAQTFRDLELVICDDGSTNAEVDRVLMELQDLDDRVRVRIGPATSGEYKRDHACTFAAMINGALRATDSPLLSYLVDDAWYMPRRCELLIDWLLDTEVGLVWGQQALARGDVITRPFAPAQDPNVGEVHSPQSLVTRLPRGNFIDHSSAVHRRVAGAWWDESPAAWADLDRRYWITLAHQRVAAAFLPWVESDIKSEGDHEIGAMIATGGTIADVVETRR